MKKKIFFLIFFLAGFSGGCISSSYPGDKLKQAIVDICRKEYQIEDVDVKVVGKTIGVYLPVPRLFLSDFKEAAITGKVRNLETLFEPSPEAMEKVEDVMLTISRVILSTDKNLDFYTLQATDTEKTGMELIFTGYVMDIKRVRIADISRKEYYKRLVQELKINRAVVAHQPVRAFVKDLHQLTVEGLQKKYFGDSMPLDAIQNLFLNKLPASRSDKKIGPWNILDIRSISVPRNQALVYTKIKPPFDAPEIDELQFLFLIGVQDETARILRIIPFQYRDESGKIHKTSFPKELLIEENLDQWEEEFPLKEIKLGPFLAEQLTRRAKALLAADERILHTFRDEIKLEFQYHEEPHPYFSFSLSEASLKDFNNYSRNSLIFHEDMIYLLTLVSREFVDVLRSYQFGDYDSLNVNLAQDTEPRVFDRDSLELFRRKKIDFQGLLSLPK